MFKLTAALPHTFVKRPPLILWKKMQSLMKIWQATTSPTTYSQDTTTAFQELLQLIDSNTRELPSVLSPKHYAALTQLPLTYPWARLVLDLKELLPSFDRHLITCLIANHVQGNNTPHPGTVPSSFLQHLAQLILLIIAPHDTDDAPPFLHHPEIYNLEFWHAHLNYACTRFATSHGSDRLLAARQSNLPLD